MGIFNEHSSNQHPFAKGLQGAPGVGFNLTADGNYDMVGKKLTNVGNPTSNTDATNKKYVDDNSGGGKTSLITVDSNIDMRDTFRILNLKSPSDADEPVTKNYAESNFFYRDGSQPMTGDKNMNNKKIENLSSPTVNGDAANKKYVDDSKVDGSVFVKLDGTRVMTGNLNMNKNRIFNIPNPTGPQQPTPLAYGDLAYLKVDGSNKMTNNLNMENKKIIKLLTPTDDTDAATKKYVDDKSTNPQDLSPYLKKDGSGLMTGNLNLSGNKIINLEDPVSDNDAVNKIYMKNHFHTAQVQPSHYKDEFSYLMSSPSQWTDEIDNRNSFYPRKIADLLPSQGNFHDYNHKVLYIDIIKNFQGGYKFKMGLNFYRLVGGADYTLCLEILNKDYQLWHKTQISVDNNSSQGLKLDNVGVKKLQYRFTNSKGQTEFMYYHRLIVNFKKLTTGNKFFIHILVNIPQDGSDLAIYPTQFSNVYLIAYGIMSKVSNIDPDKVYDYHTAFDIQKTQLKYNVDINANQKVIRNIKLEQGSNNSAATVGMVKELIPFTKKYVYRKYFEDFCYFKDANSYNLNSSSSGIVITGIGNKLTIPNRTIKDLEAYGLNLKNYKIMYLNSSTNTSFTLCIVFQHFKDSTFTLEKIHSRNSNNINLIYNHLNNQVSFNSKNKFTLTDDFDDKYIVIWWAFDRRNGISKISISNYASTITESTSFNSFDRPYFKFLSSEGIINKLMFSNNFYDFDSEAFKKIMLEEKLDGSYIL